MIGTRRLIAWTVSLLALLSLVTVLTVVWLWQDRPPLDELPWPIVEAPPDTDSTVSATWLGGSTLLFDDGVTQILVDGAFSRLRPLDVVLMRPVTSDIATINYAMDEFRIDRLAAIVTGHSHFDHAMDAGRVANRSTALLIGSESTANIARGADVPVEQFQILASGEQRIFGDFTITLLESRHVPIGPWADGWPAGVIDEPLRQPARFWAWKGGEVYSILISHPAGTALVQGSAGYIDGVLDARPVDVVFLSVAGLAARGPEYTRSYWNATVGATGASEVYVVHFDDFTRPFGSVELFPTFIDDVITTAGRINEIAAADGVDLQRPAFGRPVKLY